MPLLVKIAPDLDDEDVLEVADLAVALGLDGIVATNTTISREGLASPAVQVEAAGAGGLSGPPLRERATEVMRLLRGRVGPEMTLIGVGGITTVEDALERLDAGADLLQAYTAFVYEGPWWPVRINAGVREHLQDRADQPSDAGRADDRIEPVAFGQRLRDAMDDRGPLCAGIDPHRGLLEAWGLHRLGRRAGEVRAVGRRGAGARSPRRSSRSRRSSSGSARAASPCSSAWSRPPARPVRSSYST